MSDEDRKIKAREASAKWRRENPNYKREYRAKNPDKVLAQGKKDSRKFRSENVELLRNWRAVRYAKDSDRVLEINRRWRRNIMPCAIFDLTKPEHQKRCFHFSNLQPLFALDNLHKNAKVTTNQFQLL